VGQELVDGLGLADLQECDLKHTFVYIRRHYFFNFRITLLYLTMTQEQVGHLVAFLPHVFVVAELLHCSFQDLSESS